MKLYRHYKNKPYKIIGEAKHSETLEDMVVYETRYENALGKIWVRPKPMFFESVQVEGRTLPRFEKIPLMLEETTDVTDAHIDRIAPVTKKAFGEWDANWFYGTFRNHEKFHLITAVVENELVGFKMGYELDQGTFYSWLGGVVPEFRGIGIASDLMNCQHAWCLAQGYKTIQTKTQNRFREMFILNLRHGFNVIGSHDSNEGGLKIVLEKKLG